MAHIDDRELARWRRHSLGLDGPPGRNPVAVVGHLLAVQAENVSQSRWAIGCRTEQATDVDVVADIDAGEIIRTHVMRPTWHDVLREDLRWLLAITGPRILGSMRTQDRAWGIDAESVETAATVLEEELSGGGALTREQLGTRLRAEGLPGEGSALGHLIAHLELRALVCSGPTQNGQHTYALVDERVPPTPVPDRDRMLADLAARYVVGHGPVTDRDLAYWAQQTLTDARAGLAHAAEEDRVHVVEHDDRTWWAVGDLPDPSPPRQLAHVLQTLDEVHNGVQDTRHLVDLAGLAPDARTPVGMVLLDGQLSGWMRRRDLATDLVIVVEPLRQITADERAAIEEEAARYGAFVGLDGRVELV